MRSGTGAPSAGPRLRAPWNTGANGCGCHPMGQAAGSGVGPGLTPATILPFVTTRQTPGED